MFRFLHAADLHLDSPLRGLDRYEGAPAELFRGASRAALENLVKLAVEERVRFVVLAGDLFDGDWPDVNTGLFFVNQMAKLRKAGIAVYLIHGNHDAANRMTRSLPYPGNVHVLPSERPITLLVDGLPVALHGQSYGRQDVKDNLAARYPAPEAGRFNIGLLHTALNGREGHESYAPCGVEELLARGYDYWALGHAHQRESVSPNSRPLIEFPGNTQGRHVRETGAKGCLIVHVDSDLNMTKEFHALDVCRWARVEVNCQGVGARDELLERVEQELEAALEKSEGRPLAARVVLHGPCPLHNQLLARRETLRDDIRARGIDLASDRLWIEQVEVRTVAPSGEGEKLELAGDALSEIVRLVQQLRGDFETLRSILGTTDFNHLRNRLPPELRVGEDALDFSTPDLAAELLERARALLLEPSGAEGDRR